jgi:cytoskeletal protein RodZ
VTVGESLTRARHQAGLSIDELSERTRIRETVIRSIEHDEYEACGGDIYVRGYVRAIAGAVGIDAQPLIRQYDQAREIPTLAAVGTDLVTTRFDLSPFPGDPAETSFDLPPVTGDPPVTENLMAAGYELSPAGIVEPAETAVPGPRARAAQGETARARSGNRRRRGLLTGVAAVVALAVIAVIGVRLASSSPASRNTAATSVPRTVPSSAAPGQAAATAPAKSARPAQPARSAKPAKTAASVKPRRRARPRRASTPPITMLPVAAAEAFGPDGLADGDNPGIAHYAITGDAPLPWSSQWYVTPEFGMLKHGTGLLLDLGRRVTITSVRLDLTEYQGANLQIRVGDSTNPDGFTTAATVTGTGGVVRLTLRHPASARYLLVWFTRLPPNGAGQYEESVSGVLVNGRRS